MDEDTATTHRTESRYLDLPSRLAECLQEQLNESDVHLDDSLSNSNAKCLLKPRRH